MDPSDMATWSGFSDEEVTKVKLQIIPPARKIVQEEEVYSRSQPEEAADDTVCTTESVISEEQPDCTEQQPSNETKNDLLESHHSESSLEVLRNHQERLKQENLERKFKIENALKKRYETSSKEVEKLQFVRKELSKVDGLVTQDVSVLRERIEEADKNFNKARTRLSAAEKEYVAAKLSFYTAKEQKELLSEHLCTIIRHNESRKALKLKNLMSDLQLEDNDTSEQLTLHEVDRPNPPVARDEIPLGASMISIQRLD